MTDTLQETCIEVENHHLDSSKIVPTGMKWPFNTKHNDRPSKILVGFPENLRQTHLSTGNQGWVVHDTIWLFNIAMENPL